MTSQPIRVAVVDDHPMYRMGLAGEIREMPGIEILLVERAKVAVHDARDLGIGDQFGHPIGIHGQSFFNRVRCGR